MEDETNYDELNPNGVDDSELNEFDDMVSAALGGGEFPRPVDWSTLTAAERRTQLRRLWPGGTEPGRPWPGPPAGGPPGWFPHQSVARIPSALPDAYLNPAHATHAAYSVAFATDCRWPGTQCSRTNRRRGEPTSRAAPTKSAADAG